MHVIIHFRSDRYILDRNQIFDDILYTVCSEKDDKFCHKNQSSRLNNDVTYHAYQNNAPLVSAVSQITKIDVNSIDPTASAQLLVPASVGPTAPPRMMSQFEINLDEYPIITLVNRTVKKSYLTS